MSLHEVNIPLVRLSLFEMFLFLLKMDRAFFTLIPLHYTDVVGAFEVPLLCSASVSAHMLQPLASSRLR